VSTVLTDMADHPPHFWIEPDLAQHVVCGTSYARSQALATGCDPSRVHLVSGMILRPDFYAQQPMSPADERRQTGLDPDEPTGLVLFGGTGSRAMIRIAERLPDTQLILMCGRNWSLAERLRALPSRAPRAVVGYTPDVARWMGMADFFIGKPGPGSLSEAVQAGLPVIVTLNAWAMPQERWNADWVRQNGLGVVDRSFRTVRQAVNQIVRHLSEYRSRVALIDNRAVFDVPEILNGILMQSRAPCCSTRPLKTPVLAQSSA
jgi:UDP-N-acetylglucosamine:LPS N-acetylglucosamine transferase